MKSTSVCVFALALSAIPQQASAADRTLTASELAIIENGVRVNFRDPEAARFKHFAYTGQRNIYCGLVNGKNAYGGYVGYEPFMVKVVENATPSGPRIASLELVAVARATDAFNRQLVLAGCENNGYRMQP